MGLSYDKETANTSDQGMLKLRRSGARDLKRGMEGVFKVMVITGGSLAICGYRFISHDRC
jgi:hypothetical protein|nr:hypothetical protein Q903MT_gene129 [Picea sitchensis]